MGSFAVLAAGSGMLLLGGGAALLFERRRVRRHRVRARFGLVLEAYVPPRPMAPVPLMLRQEPERSVAQRLLRLFGVEPERTAHLPVRWYVLLGATFGIARLLAGVVEMMAGSWGLLAWPVLWVVASRTLSGWFANRHARALFKQFPDALAMIVRAVRIGIPVSQAVRTVAADAPRPTAGEFARLADALSVGTPLDEAMTELAERNGLPEYRFFAAALTLQNQTGGGLAATLENLAEVIRKRVYARAKGYALAAEARMSALVLTVLPVFTFGALLVVSPDYVGVLFGTGDGHMVLGAAIALLGLGQGSMQLMIRKSLS